MTKFRFIVANLYRKAIRSAMTFASLFVAYFLFIALGSVGYLFSGNVELEGGASRIQSSSKFSIIEMLPYTHVTAVRELPGVELVSHMTWFGGYYQDPRNEFPVIPVEGMNHFAVMDEMIVDDAVLNQWVSTPRGALVPQELATTYNWKVGDLIPIGAQIYALRDGSMTWEFEMIGTYDPGRDFPAFLINYEYFDKARAMGEGTVGWMMTKVADMSLVDELSVQIDGLFEFTPDPTRSVPESQAMKEWASQLGDIGLMVTGILSAVFFTILLLTANTMSQSFRERISELAVLKTLGFTDGAVSILVLVEAILLCLFPAIFAVGLALVLEPLVVDGLSNMMMGFPFAVADVTLLGVFAIAIGLGIAVGLLPAISAKKIAIVDGLRA